MKKNSKKEMSFEDFKRDVLRDFYYACLSRQTSILGRKEVLNGRGKFGIFGDGKEIPQVVLAKYLKKGDFRSGYYRDQTMMLALGVTNVEDIFCQLYGSSKDKFSGGRQMANHYCTPFINEKGEWLNLTQHFNVSSDISPTASQVPRAVGLALASKLFRQNKDLHQFAHLSHNGDEVCICTIGDGATSEGHFWESLNAAGVMQVPLVVLVWDDGYGISVPKDIQTVKGSVSKAFSGLQQEGKSNGFDIVSVKGWDYPALCIEIERAIEKARHEHIPILIHVEELTQPLGHSTSGSHERYKSKERLEWEKEFDCLAKMREWLIKSKIAEESEINYIEQKSKDEADLGLKIAWKSYYYEFDSYQNTIHNCFQQIIKDADKNKEKLDLLYTQFKNLTTYSYKDFIQYINFFLAYFSQNTPEKVLLEGFIKKFKDIGQESYNTNLYCRQKSPLSVKTKGLDFKKDAPLVNGFEVLNSYFGQLFSANPLVIAFGEDVGKIGDVNQGFNGLQKKFGKLRIMDTGIREITIIGKGMGMALRGLRPIAEIQYLDYLIYGLQPLVDDVVTTSYRTNGKQACPLIVRTRGHRLEGIFHSGSPMGMLINGLRGMHICVPRNMTQAVGFYNTLLKGNDPGLVIECLNGYRIKEKLASNLLDYTLALGEIEVLRHGKDISIVSYGSVLRIIQEAANFVKELYNIECEVIDIQTLLPFDKDQQIAKSLQKTNRLLIVDEDVPGGASAYILQKIIEEQKGYFYLDSKPMCLTAKEHRPAYGNDGDYFSKPNINDIIESILKVVKE